MDLYATISIFLTFFCSCNSHPQCLDFRPPYSPTKPLSFCSQYSNYSCCNENQDRRLQHNYKYISQLSERKHRNKEVNRKCLDIVKELTCLECHPYAAHVFDAETFSGEKMIFEKRLLNFPGLCKNYCLGIFEECKKVFLQLALTEKFRTFMNSSNATEFCSWAAIPDENYCYPEINNFEEKQIKLEQTYKNKLCVEPFAHRYFANALVAVHSNDNSHRLFVGEQRGLVYVILPNGTTVDKPFLNLTSRVVNSGNSWDERGFLGLAFHPQYKTNGRFFIYYSAFLKDEDEKNLTAKKVSWYTKHKTRISEMTVDPNDAYRADHTSEQAILEVDQPEPNHNGGMLMFGEDGYLYIFIGDGGGSGDRHGRYGNGQLMSTLLGKALRIDVDVENKLYGIPQDNPYLHSQNVRSEIYASGLRNAWRCSVDRGDLYGRKKGRILCGDVGQNRYEEIDIIQKGKNYGWRAFEGFSCFDEQLCNKTRNGEEEMEPPILVYNHTVGRSIVGGYVYRGCDSPNLYGKYIFGDTMNGRMFIAMENNSKESKTTKSENLWSFEEINIGDDSFCNNGLHSSHHRHILSFGESESGEIFILAAAYPNPRMKTSLLYRLVDPTRRGDPDTCRFTPDLAKALGKIKRREVFRYP